MKNIGRIVFSLLLCSFLQLSFAQDIDIEACGVDDALLLNQAEAAYFNFILEEYKGDFDFEGKRVAFAQGNWGKERSSKSEYFRSTGKPRWGDRRFIANQLIILTEEERKVAPDIDAIVVTWSKLSVQNKSRKKLIQRTGKRVKRPSYPGKKFSSLHE